MPSKYKVTYFPAKGLGEPIRFLLSYMEEEFEDIRITGEQWLKPNTKSETPFGKLPYLEEDDKVLTQSVAICRYLGNKAGIAGEDAWENYKIDSIVDTLVDLRMPMSAWFFETNEDLKKTMKETYIKETVPFYFKKIDALVNKNGGYLANNKLSWADLFFSAFSEFMSNFCEVPDVTIDYSNLHALREKVFNLPQIKKWRANRPTTQY